MKPPINLFPESPRWSLRLGFLAAAAAVLGLGLTATAAQLSGTVSYTGTRTGPVKVTAVRYLPSNHALKLDGAGDFVRTTIADLSGTELTIQFWFKGSSIQSAVRQQSGGWVIAGWNNLHILSHDGGVGGISTGSATDGQWHHVAMTWKQNDSHGFSSYLDGQLVTSRPSVDTSIPNHAAAVYFGAFNGVGEFASGQMDEIAIFRRARSAGELASTWNQPVTGAEDGLEGLWTFEDDSFNALSPSAHTGTPGGDATIVGADIPGLGGALFNQSLATPGAFSLGVTPGEGYQLTAFMDVNGNGIPDAGEPQGAYTGNPFDVNDDVSGLEIQLKEPPAIAVHPGNARASVGGSATFSVEATGTAPLGYQWFRGVDPLVDDGRIAGSATASLSINNVSTNDAGFYTCVVSNALGSVTSHPGELQVVTGGADISGTVHYAGTRTGKVIVSATLPKTGNQVLRLDGIDDTVATNLRNLAGSELTIQFWFRGPVIQSAVRQQSGGWVIAGWNNLHIMSHDGGVGGISTGNAIDGRWHHVAFTWKQGAANGWVSYLDGRQVTARNAAATPIPDHNAPVYFGSFNGVGEFTKGDMDEISLWRRALSPGEIAAGYRGTLTGAEADLIGAWSFDDGTANDKGPSLFTGSLANGAEIVSVDNTELGVRVFADRTGPGAYTIVGAPFGIGYLVSAFLDANGNGVRDPDEPAGEHPGNPLEVDVTRTGIDITLFDPPVFTSPAGTFSFCPDAEATLAPVVRGTSPVTYQWSRDGVPLVDDDAIEGTQTATLHFLSVNPSHQGRYTLSAVNAAGSASQSYFVQVSCGPVTDQLAGYWPFDETEGLLAADYSGLGNDGELRNFPEDNTQWVVGKIGGSLNFGGPASSDFVRVAAYPKPTRVMSASGWVFAETRPTWASIIKNWGGSQVGQFHFGLQENAGDLSDYITTGSGGVLSTREGTVLPVGSWQHVAFVADGLQLRLYRNGVQVGTPTPYDGTFFTSPISALGIGVKLDNAGENADAGAPGFWHGRIDDLALWTRALSAQEIAAIHVAGTEGRPLDQTEVPVRLAVTRLDNSVVIRWPASAAGYQLESTGALPGDVWEAVATPPVVVDGFNTVTEAVTPTTRFYRLRR